MAEQHTAVRHFDVVVIGTGAAASTVAHGCRRHGWEVAIIDSRPFGGTCALRGCDPKRILVGAAEVLDRARALAGKGLAGSTAIDWPSLMAFKRSLIAVVPAERERSYAKAGIVAYHGRACFTGPGTVAVGDEELEARFVVIASGQQPRRLNIPNEELLATSEQFLDLDQLPRRIIFVGGGYISFELAHVAARAGAAVTILHRGERPLEHFDTDLVRLLVARTRALGVQVELGTEVMRIERHGDAFAVHARSGATESTCSADLVVHGAGRVAEIDDLDLPRAGVARTKAGVRVNEYLQSVSNEAVYAAGDAAASPGPPLTPVAGYEGRIVVDNLINGNKRSAEYGAIPTVTFTTPALAAVGMSEDTARAAGLRFRSHFEETSRWYSSRRVGETHAGFKVLVEEGTDRILGAHLLGPGAEATINLFTLAIRAGLKTKDLTSVLFAYPTAASEIPYML